MPVAVRHGRPVFDIIQMLSETYGNAVNAMPKMIWGHAAFSVLRQVPVKHEYIFIGDGIMKRLNLLLAFIGILSITACNTVQGVGKDIQAGGKAVEKVAK
jgi:entericidin B